MGNEMKDIYWETVLITLGEQIYNLEANLKAFKFSEDNMRTGLDHYRNEAKAWEEKYNALEAEKNRWVEKYRALEQKYAPERNETYEESEPYDA